MAVGTTEIANNMRTVAYLQNGLGGSVFSTTIAADPCPTLEGSYVSPPEDAAPWYDVDRPESRGFLGLLIDTIDGLDTTSTRTVDDAATGVGGILGPETLKPRAITVKGWFIADGCPAMEYGRRWLGDVLAGALCDGCGAGNYIDVFTTCGEVVLAHLLLYPDTPILGPDAPILVPDGWLGDPDLYQNRWRLYDVGLTAFETDLSGGVDCCYVTPVTFTVVAGNPYLYGPEVSQVEETFLNEDGPDAPPVPFEDWLFNDETAVCATLVAEQLGESSPIVTFYGGESGIEAGLVYTEDPLYPAESLYPSSSLYPGIAPPSGGGTPYVFSFHVGPAETFVIDAAQQRVTRTLSDGVTEVDGSDSLYMQPGDVIAWPSTCAGDLVVCARAYAACTCDDSASVTITSMHREK